MKNFDKNKHNTDLNTIKTIVTANSDKFTSQGNVHLLKVHLCIWCYFSW